MVDEAFWEAWMAAIEVRWPGVKVMVIIHHGVLLLLLLLLLP